MRGAIFGLLLAFTISAYGHGGGGCNGSAFGFFGPGNPEGRFYESPRMDQDYKFGGFILKVPRRDFRVYLFQNAGNRLAEFVSESISIRVTRLPKSAESLQSAVAQCAPKGLVVIRSYPIRTTRGVKGVKTVYGLSRKGYHPIEICYVYPTRPGDFVCFRAVPILRYPDWTEANRLVTGDLRYDKS